MHSTICQRASRPRESVNAVVSVRRKTAGKSLVPDDDLAVVNAALGKHAHLRDHIVRVEKSAIVVFEPYPRRDQLDAMGFLGTGVPHSFIEDRMRKARFDPVMKFDRTAEGYEIYRTTYRGKGGWSYGLDTGALNALVKKYVRHVGTEGFFDLM